MQLLFLQFEMKPQHRSDFLLVFSLFFYFAAGLNILQGSSSPVDSIWDEQIENLYEKDAKDPTSGCGTNMRLFGPDNQYRCNCKNLHDCNFGKNGECNGKKCNIGFGGSFCQKICYDEYLAKDDVFTREKTINRSMTIDFRYLYRINYIRMDCKTTDPSVTVTLHVNSTEFCNKKCLSNTICTGDGIGENLNITISGNNPIVSLWIITLSGCSPFWFGETCDKQCHCDNNEECHKFTGKCPNGCEKGRSGPGCQKLNYENVALNKHASQSSTYPRDIILNRDSCKKEDFQFSANLAVDGNIDQQHERSSCMHTRGGGVSQWIVNLEKEYNISHIRIYNRNIKSNRHRNAVIHSGNHKCYKIKEAKKVLDIKCDSVITGENITITQEWAYLNFCEVEVLQCLPGFYGDRCSKSCSKCKNASCDQWTGRCISGCVAGYWQNDTQPCAACSPGMFGENCAKTCCCKDNMNCHKETGFCGAEEYEKGYQGKECQKFKINISIPIIIVLSVLLVIISVISIYLKIKLKEIEHKISVKEIEHKISANEPTVKMNTSKNNDNVYDDGMTFEEQENLYVEI